MDANQTPNPDPMDWREQRRRERWERRQARWDARRAGNPAGGAIFGALMIAFGLLFLLRNLGVVFIDDLWSYWPVILIALGASKLFQARGGHVDFGGAVLVLVGGVFLMRNLGILWFNPFALIGPGILIILGVSILMRNIYGPEWWGGPGTGPGPFGPAGPGPRMETSEGRIYGHTVFGGIHRRVNSQEFEGGRVSATLGGLEIDLRDAKMKDSQAVLHVDVLFGGADIRVPDTWLVEVHGSPILGGFDDRTHKPADVANAPRLIIQGSATFGGVSVRN